MNVKFQDSFSQESEQGSPIILNQFSVPKINQQIVYFFVKKLFYSEIYPHEMKIVYPIS